MKKFIYGKDKIPDSIKCEECGCVYNIPSYFPIFIDKDEFESVFSDPNLKDIIDKSVITTTTLCMKCKKPLFEIKVNLKELK